MRVSERLTLVDKIARELQARYRYDDIDHFLFSFGISPPANVSVNSKWVYSKSALANASDEILYRIAEELTLDASSDARVPVLPPANWVNSDKFKLFVSHISKDKEKATRLRDTLAVYGISAFVAHEDIHPSKEWQIEIERALSTMDAFVSMHTDGFSASNWTQQEVGFAIARQVKIIPIRMGEDPTGFLSKIQAISRKRRTAEEISAEVVSILAKDPKTSDRMRVASTKPKTIALDDIPF